MNRKKKLGYELMYENKILKKRETNYKRHI